MTSPRIPAQAPGRSVVIIGAGLAGASTAYHLRLRGVTDVRILEREALPGTHSSGRNAAIVREDAEVPELQALWTESVAKLRGASLAPFRACGGLLLGSGSEPAAARIPLAAGAGRFRAGDGIVDVAALMATYLRGVRVETGVEVKRIRSDAAGLRVETASGLVLADVVVNAAGAWAGALGALPLTPTNRHLHVTTRMPQVDPSWPYLWDVEAGYYFRPESGGLLLCSCDERAGTPGEPDVDPLALEQLAEKLRIHQPRLANVTIRRSWVGQRTFAADRRPVIGADPRVPGLFHVAALGGFGVTLSYTAGRLAAEAVLVGQDGEPGTGVGRLLSPAKRTHARG